MSGGTAAPPAAGGAAPTPPAGSVPAGGGPFAGVGRMSRFALRRDRVRIVVWALALSLPQPMVAAAFADLYPTAADREVAGQTFGTPAAIAMTGPVDFLEDYTVGSMTAHQMLGFTAILVGVMSVLLVVRHTRAEEESGRAELVRSARVGRHASLMAGLCSALVANLAVGALITLGMGVSGANGVDWPGSVVFGAAHVGVGLAFAGVAAVTVQVTEHARAAAGLAMAVVGVAYLLRAVGDVLQNGLPWVSPIGWAQQSFPYLQDRIWPLLLGPLAGLVLAVVGMALSTRRDLGAGLRATRAGRRTGSTVLRTPLGFAFRLHRALLVGFAIALVVLGGSYGAFMSQVEDMLQGMSPEIRQVFVRIGDVGLAETFASTVLMVIALVATAYPLMAVSRPSAEETRGRAEPVLATALSRTRWLGSHVVVALFGGALMQLLGGVGLGGLGALTLGDLDFLERIGLASLAYVPAIWFATGVAVVLYGWVPRWAPAVWLVLVYGFLDGYLGAILQFPDWMNNLNPYGHVPLVPAEEVTWTPLLALTGIAVGLIIVGLLGFRRRDLRLT